MFQSQDALQKRIVVLITKAKKLLSVAKKKKKTGFVKSLAQTLKKMSGVMKATKKPKPNFRRLGSIVKSHEVKVNTIAMKLLGPGDGDTEKVCLNLYSMSRS